MAPFAYLFERFPSFTQTFCYREVLEMHRQAGAVPVYSIRRPQDAPEDLTWESGPEIVYLPPPDALLKEMTPLRMTGRYGWRVIQALQRWGKQPDRSRLMEAAWLGRELEQRGIRHVHAHFAGIAARTAYWLKQFHGITYSFTGHANDLFCEPDFPVTLEDLVREAEAVVTEADFSRDWLRRRYAPHAGKIHRIYNGIDADAFPPARPNPDGCPLIISVGRCIEKKGYADLVDACALLRQRGVAFQCVIIGGGPLEEPLREQVAARGLEGVVWLTGPQPQPEVRRYLAQATLFVLACATESGGGMDNFPTVIAEAMAAGLPVISTRLAGVPEMVSHGVTGFLTAEKQPGALAEAMEALLGNPSMGRQFGEAGRAAVAARFAVNVTVRQLRELLEKFKPL